MMGSKPYWFPAKRYGWGWGFPATWQGWVVLVTYTACFTAAAVTLPRRGQIAEYLATAFVLTGLFIWICWVKGEPPRWRWGGD